MAMAYSPFGKSGMAIFNLLLKTGLTVYKIAFSVFKKLSSEL